MAENINILFLGDIVGKPGRNAVTHFLGNVELYLGLKPDFVIANCENASHGFGLTEKNYHELLESGIDILTSGNHIWDRKEIYKFIDNAEYLVRPYNYPEGTPGQGYKAITKNKCSITVVNLLGRIFMEPYDSQWSLMKSEILKFQLDTPILLVDFHAEATAEKLAFGYFLADMGATAMIGTHTHVQTADEQLINGNMAYITDVGYCGARHSIIGMDIDTSIKRLSTLLPNRYEIPGLDEALVCGVLINVDKNSGVSRDIKRIQTKIDLKNLLEEDKLK